jgi:hypothetical protein
MKAIKRIWMGAGYLEGYGHHPGWPVFGIFILASGLAGIRQGGLGGFIGGCVVGLVCLGPFFMIGCYSRAKDYEVDVKNTFNKLKRNYNG